MSDTIRNIVESLHTYHQRCQLVYTLISMELSQLLLQFLILHQLTPLHMAAEKGHCEHILKYLVKADINIKDSNGVSTISIYYQHQ